MTTVNIDLSETYIQITTLADFSVLNSTNKEIRLVVNDNKPSDDTKAFMLIPSDCGVTSAQVTGTIWARVNQGTGSVIVTE